MTFQETAWATFASINERRRSVRDFTGEPVDDEAMRAILSAAQLAPSSGNLQPYEFHWVRDAGVRAQLALACGGQRAASSAGCFVVVVARWRGIRGTYSQFLAHVDQSEQYDQKAKAYHHGRKKEIDLLTGAPVLRFVVGGLMAALSLVSPHFVMGPLGSRGIHQWAARNSALAAQTLLLAAAARGLDSCPMEGFNPFKVAKILGLGRDVVIPLVIALGKRTEDARIEPRWRRPFDDVVVVH